MSMNLAVSLVILLSVVQLANADCSCSIGGNGIYVLGFEFIATSCPADPPSDDQQYLYNIYPVNCVGGKITKYSSYGDTSASPNSLFQYYTGNGYRVIRNPGGTHLIMVQNGNYPYQGVVAGLSMYGRPAGVYQTDPPEALNEICTPVSSPADLDGDGFPDCLDCKYNDPEQNIKCDNNNKNFGPPCDL